MQVRKFIKNLFRQSLLETVTIKLLFSWDFGLLSKLWVFVNKK